MNWFKRDVHHYHIVEFDRQTKLSELSGDLRESLRTLEIHPAFQYIMQRFRVKKASMAAALQEGYKLSEQELRYLQSGIFWAGELERDIQVLTQTQPQRRPAKVDEMEEFNKVARSIELIGQDDSSSQG